MRALLRLVHDFSLIPTYQPWMKRVLDNRYATAFGNGETANTNFGHFLTRSLFAACSKTTSALHNLPEIENLNLTMPQGPKTILCSIRATGLFLV